jgi:hypothetical protein
MCVLTVRSSSLVMKCVFKFDLLEVQMSSSSSSKSLKMQFELSQAELGSIQT